MSLDKTNSVDAVTIDGKGLRLSGAHVAVWVMDFEPNMDPKRRSELFREKLTTYGWYIFKDLAQEYSLTDIRVLVVSSDEPTTEMQSVIGIRDRVQWLTIPVVFRSQSDLETLVDTANKDEVAEQFARLLQRYEGACDFGPTLMWFIKELSSIPGTSNEGNVDPAAVRLVHTLTENDNKLTKALLAEIVQLPKRNLGDSEISDTFAVGMEHILEYVDAETRMRWTANLCELHGEDRENEALRQALSTCFYAVFRKAKGHGAESCLDGLRILHLEFPDDIKVRSQFAAGLLDGLFYKLEQQQLEGIGPYVVEVMELHRRHPDDAQITRLWSEVSSMFETDGEEYETEDP